MQYICHTKYDKKAACGEYITFKQNAILETVGKFIAYGQKAICTITSEDAYKYFARNDDGKGLERGRLTHAIAYSKRTPNEENSFRFTDEEAEMLETEYGKYLRKDTDTIIFNYDFFNASIEDLQKIAKRLNLERRQ